MSMPNFPSISPEITREMALNMILASIAMEELGLSHIINAEGEKIQYVLNELTCKTGYGASVEDILAVNKSVESLLEVLMQNQMFLKGKMERVLEAMEGDLGPTGPTGPAGPEGPVGPCGPIGETGPRGEIGPKGDVGPVGPMGPMGEVGPRGEIGPRGIPGPIGGRGEMGQTGPTGPTGPKGESGTTGEMGPTGAMGEKGERGLKGDKGDRGEQGVTGSVGPTGPTGECGPKGDKGDAGAMGPCGIPGPMGLKGERGPQGPAGDISMNGVASFIETNTDYVWRLNTAFPWVCNFIKGNGISYSNLENGDIILLPNKYFLISASINILGVINKKNISVSCTASYSCKRQELFVYHIPFSTCVSTPMTLSVNGLLIDTCGYQEPVVLSLYLLSHESIHTSKAYLSIVEC
jgi:hypothetical protein